MSFGELSAGPIRSAGRDKNASHVIPYHPPIRRQRAAGSSAADKGDHDWGPPLPLSASGKVHRLGNLPRVAQHSDALNQQRWNEEKRPSAPGSGVANQNSNIATPTGGRSSAEKQGHRRSEQTPAPSRPRLAPTANSFVRRCQNTSSRHSSLACVATRSQSPLPIPPHHSTETSAIVRSRAGHSWW